MSDPRTPREQQEPVHAPVRDADPPKRSPTPVVWILVTIVGFAALAVALIIAAITTS